MKTKMIEGKVYIPAEIRRLLPSNEFVIEFDGEKIILKPIKKDINKYYGILKIKKHLTPNEIDKKLKEETEKVLKNEIH